jgi:hypothetical protein
MPALKTWTLRLTHPPVQVRQTRRTTNRRDDVNKKPIGAQTAGMILMVGALLGAGDRLQAQGESGDRAAREQARRIEGVWLPIVTITDCQTQAVIATFPSMDIYVRGGGFIGFGAVQKSDQVGMGAWRHAGGRNYVSEYQFFNYAPAPFGAPDGPPDGTLLKVSSAIRLNVAGTAFTTSETADLLDAAGNVLARNCAHRTATRLQ